MSDQDLSQLKIKSIGKEHGERITRGNRKVWNQTNTEQDFIARCTDPNIDHRIHNRAMAVLMSDERARRDLYIGDQVRELGFDSDVPHMKQQTFRVNVRNSRKNIWKQREVSDWRRLKMRQLWQDAVYSNNERKDFWNDTTKVAVLHSPDMFQKTKRRDVRGGMKSLKKFENMINHFTGGSVAELSCVAQDKNSSNFPFYYGGNIQIEFLQREIVWASKEDSWTQFLSSANDETKEYFQMMKELEELGPSEAEKIFVADLVKFPSSRINPKNVLFSERDFMEFANGLAKEVIIRRYTLDPDSIIIRLRDTLEPAAAAYLEEGIQNFGMQYFNNQFIVERF